MKKAIKDNTIQFMFDDGELITFRPGMCTEAVKQHAMMHGFLQRLGDNAAISRKQKDGSVIDVTEEMRRNAVLELVNHYESGTEQWELKTARGPVENQVIRAIATKRGCTYQEAEAFLANQHLGELSE